jgi:hypothetical protein
MQARMQAVIDAEQRKSARRTSSIRNLFSRRARSTTRRRPTQPAAKESSPAGGTEGEPKPHNRDGDCRRNRNLDRNSFRFAARLVGPDNWFGCENADLCSTAVLRLISSKLK